MIIAVDFDGTIQREDGSANRQLIARLIQAQRAGSEVILWSCRTGESLALAVRFCAEHGLRFNYINENSVKTVKRLKENPRKIYADVYIDDKAVMP